jgi:hypothetical protein
MLLLKVFFYFGFKNIIESAVLIVEGHLRHEDFLGGFSPVIYGYLKEFTGLKTKNPWKA